MKTNRTPFSRKQPGQLLLQPRQLLFSRKIGRHGRWVTALAARFSLKNHLLRHPGSDFIFASLPRRSLLFLQRIQHPHPLQYQFVPSASSPSRFLERQFFVVKERPLPGLPHPFTSQTSTPGKALLASSPQIARRLAAAFILSGETRTRAASSQFQAATPLDLQFPWLTAAPGVRQTHRIHHAGTLEVTTRIQRRLRRVEDPLLPGPASVSAASRSAFVAPLRMENFVQAPDSVLESPRKAETLASLPAPPALNLNQITDEVMRQLDRRLVSTRERMGKI
jgi:hypothetical protein